MLAEGRLSLEIAWNGQQVGAAAIRSTRPLDASRLLEGRFAGQAVATVPLLFSICGRAQAVATATARAAAAGRVAGAALMAQRRRMVAAECLQEHLWRFLLDLPVLLGEAPQRDEFLAVRRRCAEVAGKAAAGPRWWDEGAAGDAGWRALAKDTDGFVARSLFGMPCAEWLGMAEEGFDAWLNQGATPTAHLLGRLGQVGAGGSPVGFLPRAEKLLRGLAPALERSGDFVRAPLWNGAPAETGALARQASQARPRAASGSPVVARLRARLVELARLPGWLHEPPGDWVSSTMPRLGRGLAAVETARGTLVHDVALDGDKVARWRILAPTEWNFHPDGAFAKGLVGYRAQDEAEVRRAAALLAYALDPCVAYGIQVTHA